MNFATFKKKVTLVRLQEKRKWTSFGLNGENLEKTTELKFKWEFSPDSKGNPHNLDQWFSNFFR